MMIGPFNYDAATKSGDDDETYQQEFYIERFHNRKF